MIWLKYYKEIKHVKKRYIFNYMTKILQGYERVKKGYIFNYMA